MPCLLPYAGNKKSILDVDDQEDESQPNPKPHIYRLNKRKLAILATKVGSQNRTL